MLSKNWQVRPVAVQRWLFHRSGRAILVGEKAAVCTSRPKKGKKKKKQMPVSACSDR